MGLVAAFDKLRQHDKLSQTELAVLPELAEGRQHDRLAQTELAVLPELAEGRQHNRLAQTELAEGSNTNEPS